MRLFVGYLMVLLVGLLLGTLVPSQSLPWTKYEVNPVYSSPLDWEYYENSRFSIKVPPGFVVTEKYSDNSPYTVIQGPGANKLEIYSGKDFADRPIKVPGVTEEQSVYDQEVPKGEVFYIDGDRHHLRFWHEKGDTENEQLLYRMMSTFRDMNEDNFAQ